MRKALPASLVLAALISALGFTLAEEPGKQSPLEFQAGEGKIRFYGFLRLDVQYDDSKPNDPQVIAWIRSEDDTAPVSAIVARPNDDQLNLHAKLSRLGMDIGSYTVPKLGGAKVSGKLEIDFFNTSTSESREALRIRHAYLELAWKHTALLFGQTVDVISPLIPAVNADFSMWNAGNLADRRPQIRFTYSPKIGESGTFILQAAVGMTGAVDNQTLDASPAGTSVVSNLDGVDSGRPTTQLRLAYNGGSWVKEKKFEVGVWGHAASEELSQGAAPINGHSDWDSHAIGLGLKLPIAKRLDFEGEIWEGKNLDDVRGGIGQGVNVTAGDPHLGEEIESSGGWAQLGVTACDWFLVYLGYSTDNPEDGLPAVSARDLNSVWYLATRFKPTANLTFGLDYLNWTTEWTGGLNDGTDNRYNFFAQWNF